MYSLAITAQNGISVRGIVLDEDNEPVIGANITLKGDKSIGTITDIEGNFQLTVPGSNSILVVSFIGMTSQEVKAEAGKTMKIVLQSDNLQLDEVVIVGYREQKKASIVGAIVQTNAKTLERAGGVTSLGQALTGNLPGVVTTASTGMPGEEDPKIVIRAQSSWNNSDPLVLVDGIERSMSTVDIASVETISVLKDASATAVYGVKGANGVILITTKRGQEGKAQVQVKANVTMKMASKLPEKLDAYDTFILKNSVLEREMALYPIGWGYYKPMDVIEKYRNPANEEEWDRYPNVDWVKELFKNYTMSYNFNTSVSGGTKFVSYFTSIDFVHEGDLFKSFDNHRGYSSGYGYNRMNFRSNLDFNLTKTTKFSTNLFGSNGMRTKPWGAGTGDQSYWASAYRTAPDAMRPIYLNGLYGYYDPRNADVPNSVATIAASGIEKQTTIQLNTDFVLSQDLSMLTKGLNFKANFSLDHSFLEHRRGINDMYNYLHRMWVNPDSGDILYERGEDFKESIKWSTQAGSINKDRNYRKTYYSLQLNYGRQFGRHEINVMGLFSREKWATGSEFYRFREDWVFRTTYNYAMKYFIEANGAYNGSEKFDPKHRFAFFPSISSGWMISEENFMKPLTFIDMLKVRASYGKIGDDGTGGRFLYQDQWAYSGNARMGSIPSNSPYTFYYISSLGNEDISWETVEKKNLGIDYSFFGGLVSGSVDIFRDHRYDIYISGGDRAIPSYFGANAPAANLGKVKSKGYELSLRLNYIFNNGLRLWGNTNMTHATSKIIFADDPELTAAYRKKAGYAINQTHSFIDNGFINSWDDLYGATVAESNNASKLPGDYIIVDYNGDGIIDDDDQAPYGFSSTPQNTYSTTVGAEWKGLSVTVQLYGVNNVSRTIDFPTFHNSSNVAYVEGSYWSKDGSGEIPMPRYGTSAPTGANGTRYIYDASYLRLKNAEISYRFNGDIVKRMRMSSLRLYLNGDNLYLWTNMPDDRESNFSGSGSFGAYPTMRRFNLGVDITF
ncbi:MAG: TonB-dependent receptor [Bacteroides sp.]|nr:TonB-dependent receptor [Bacteroides sp.]